MSLAPTVSGSSTRADPPRWPDVLHTDEGTRDALDAALAAAPPRLRDALEERMRAGSDGDWQAVRASLWAHALACRRGASFQDVGPGGVLRVTTPSGPALLVPVTVRTPRHREGAPADVARLVSALETVLHPHRFALHLRKPLPAGYDPGPVSGAAFGWLRDAARYAHERHAPFDDPEADIALDIDLLGDDLPGAGGAWFVTAASRGPEWLGVLDRRLQRQLGRLAESVPDADIIPVLCADPRWGIGRGFQCQWLYGTPRMVAVDPDDGAVCSWPPTTAGFFGDAVARRVVGMWWLEVGDTPLAARGWAHENPWREAVADLCFPGATLRVIERSALGPTLAWTSAPATTWSVRECTRT